MVGSRVQVEREGGKRERGEGGRSNKRKHRSESLSGEDDQVHGSATAYSSATHR